HKYSLRKASELGGVGVEAETKAGARPRAVAGKVFKIGILPRIIFVFARSRSCPKTGTTWLKALAFAIVTRDKFNESTTPLLTTLPHHCLPLNESKTTPTLHVSHSPHTFLTLLCQKISKLAIEDAPFEEAFNEFCQGVSYYGPYWDHILGYWKASLERPDTMLFLKYVLVHD
ncbi:flavonol 4'-sulfotransferase, partial [Tanacetum coccineum]